MAQGYGVSWLRVLDAVEALGADIFVPGHGAIPEDPRGTRAGLRRMRQLLLDARDAIQSEVARGATEDQAAAAVKLQQDEKLPNYAAQREVCGAADVQGTDGQPAMNNQTRRADAGAEWSLQISDRSTRSAQ